MEDSRPASEFAPAAPPPDGCCCWPLWNHLTAAGGRGLAVVVEDAPESFMFWLQGRGVDFTDEQSLRAGLKAPSDVHVNIATSIRIRYCPWCGRRLDHVAASAAEPFARFAVAHREFVPPPV